MSIVLEIGLYFALLSVISMGGMPAVIPEMQRYVVDVKNWLAPEDFVQMYALGQAAPGPNVLIASLVGLKVAGLWGALVALIAFCAPAAVIAWWVSGLWDRFKDSPWRAIVQRAMQPMVVGLILAGGYVLATPSSPDWRMWLIAAASAIGMLYFAKLNPLWLLAGGGVLGAVLL